ncbi:ubiquitin carboxyl-terminal hydrolase 9-like protein isoform X1 [Tanacetum coccineum]
MQADAGLIVEFYEQVSALKGVDPKKVIIVDLFDKGKGTFLPKLHDSNQTPKESNMQMDQRILLEVYSNEIIRPTLGMDSTRNELALVYMEPQRSYR